MATVTATPPSAPDGPQKTASGPDSAHRELCGLAQRWLKRPFSAGGHGCALAITEGWGDGAGEHPDAIGWRRGPSDGGAVLVEVKVSRSDFLADARKPHRADPALGVGRYRYYLCPEGLIAPEEIPPRWGLLYVTSRRSVRAVAGPAAVLRHHRRGDPMRRPDGTVLWEHEAWREACLAFAFDERNHDLETAMLVALLQRLGDPEAANLAIREARSREARILKDLDLARRRADRLSWELFAARRALEDAGIPIPESPMAPRATPRLRPTSAPATLPDDAQEPTA